MWVSLSRKTQCQKCKNCSGGTTWLQFPAKGPASLFPLLFYFLKGRLQRQNNNFQDHSTIFVASVIFFFNAGYNSLWFLLPLVLLTAFLSWGLFLLLAEHHWKSDINFLFNLFSPQLYKVDKRRSRVSLTLYTAGHNSYITPFSWFNWTNSERTFLIFIVGSSEQPELAGHTDHSQQTPHKQPQVGSQGVTLEGPAVTMSELFLRVYSCL